MTVVNPKSISGINSITTGSGSDNLLTIHTSDASSTERVRINSSGNVIVGSGITVSPDGDIFATGVTTATTFVGALTGNVTGTIQTAAQSNITSVGTLTGLTVGGDISVTGDIKNGTSLIDITQNDRIEVDIAGTEIVDINGNGVDVVGGVDISGTLKLADAIQHTGDTNTQIRFPADDTVSVETAGSERLRISQHGTITNTTSSSHSQGAGTFTGDVDIADKIVHTGDTDTAIRFSGADTVTVETGGSERLRINSQGKVLVNTTTASSTGNSQYSRLEVSGNSSTSTGPAHLSLKRGTASASLSDGDTLSRLIFSSLDGGDFAYIQASVDGSPSGSDFPGRIQFWTCADGASSATERVRIDSSGRVLIGTTTEGNESADDLTLANSTNCGLSIRSGTSSNGSLFFTDATSGADEYRGFVQYHHSNDRLYFGTATTSKMYIEDTSSNGDVHIETGNIVFNTSGKGIDFGVTGNGSGTMTNELFNDYEEGTWTPTTPSGGGGWASVSSAMYRKVGNIVFLSFYGGLASQSSTNALKIGGFPYAAAGSNHYSYLYGRVEGYTANQGFWQAGAGQDYATYFYNNNLLGYNNFSANDYVLLSGFYFTA